MIVIAGALFGACLGALRARNRGGRGIDMLQYGAAHAIALALIGVFITIAIDRMSRG